MTNTLDFQEITEKKEKELSEKKRELKIIGKCDHCGTQKVLDGSLTELFTYCPNGKCLTKTA
jgi:ssDNA-binding Zn-finger/Zn-ribbon topoisomerase 1